MPNNVRIGVGVTGAKAGTSEVDALRDSFAKLQKQGAKGFAIGVGAAATTAAIQGVGNAASAAADFIGESTKAASDLGESMSKSSVVFGPAAKGIEEFGESAARSMGLSKQAAIENAASLGNLFVGLDIGQDKAASMSKEIVGLAADLGSFNNLSGGTAEALEKIRSGLSGEAEPLRSMGVFLNEAKVKAKAMEMGLLGAHGELDDGAKVLARYQVILDETKTAQGDFARTADGLANSQRIVNAEMVNAQAALGQKLLPAQLAATKGQLDLFTAVNALADGLGGKVTPELIAISRALGQMSDEQAAAYLATLRTADSLLAELDAGHHAARAIREVGEAADDAANRVDQSADRMALDIEGLRDRTIDAAREIVEDAYQVIEDKAELTATNVEKAELAKVIATGKATKEQKARYRELTHAQNKLVLDLAQNGAASQAVVTTAIAQLKKDLARATGNERKAILATLRALEALERQAINAQIALNRLNHTGLPTSNSTRYGGATPLAEGGPVTPGKVHLVGEEGPELFVPQGAGNIVPNDALQGGAGSSWGGGAGTVQHIAITVSFPGMVIAPTQAQAKQIADVIGPAIATHLRDRGMIPRR